LSEAALDPGRCRLAYLDLVSNGIQACQNLCCREAIPNQTLGLLCSMR
jgi:hypothetical protein